MLAYHEDSGITYQDCEDILKEMPYMRDGQEFLRSYLYPHDTDNWRANTMEAVEEEIGLLCHGIVHLFDFVNGKNADDIEKLINVAKVTINMLNSFYDDGNYGRAWRDIIFDYGYLGCFYFKKGDNKKALEYFKKEASLAKQFDSLERISVMHSTFFEGREFDKHTLGSTFVASSRVKFLMEERYWLNDEFKATPEFQEIIKALK